MTSLTVTLSHDEWQWVMSLVLNSQYLRAKPIVDKVEAAVAQQKQQGDALQAAKRAADDELHQSLAAHEQQHSEVLFQIRERDRIIARLEKRLEKRGKRQANGHDESAGKIRELEVQLRQAEVHVVDLQGLVEQTRASEQEKIRDLEGQLTELRAQLARAQDLGYETESPEKLGLVPPTPPGGDVSAVRDYFEPVSDADAH